VAVTIAPTPDSRGILHVRAAQTHYWRRKLPAESIGGSIVIGGIGTQKKSFTNTTTTGSHGVVQPQAVGQSQNGKSRKLADVLVLYQERRRVMCTMHARK